MSTSTERARLRSAVEAAVFEEYVEKLTALTHELTVPELVLVTGYTRVTIIGKIQAGIIDAHRVRGRYLIPVAKNRAPLRATGIRAFPPPRTPQPDKPTGPARQAWQDDGRVWVPARTRSLIAALLEQGAAASPSELITQAVSAYANPHPSHQQRHAPPRRTRHPTEPNGPRVRLS